MHICRREHSDQSEPRTKPNKYKLVSVGASLLFAFQCWGGLSKMGYSSSKNSSINSTTSPCRGRKKTTTTKQPKVVVCFKVHQRICLNPLTRSSSRDFSYLALLKRLESRAERCLPHTAPNPATYVG